MEEFVDKIRASRDLQRRSVIDTGQLLVEAKSQLTGADFRSVVKKAGLQSMPTAENYMRVAQAPHLQNPEFRSFLPVGVGALIDIAAWTEEAIRDCIAAGVMRPDVERATLRHWIVAYSNPRRSEAPENSTQYTPVWIIKADPERWTREHDERLKKCLEVEFPDRIIDLDLPRDGSRGKVKHIRRWKIYQKLKEQAAVVETLPMKDFLLMPPADHTDESFAHLGQVLASASCTELRKAAKLTVGDFQFMGVSKDQIGCPSVKQFIHQDEGGSQEPEA